MGKKIFCFYFSITLAFTLLTECSSESVQPNQLRHQPSLQSYEKNFFTELGESLATAALCYAIAGYFYIYIIKRIQAGYKNLEELEELHRLAKQAQELQQAGCVVNFPIPSITITRLDGIKNELFDTFIFPAHVAWADFWVKHIKNDRMLFIF